MGKTPQSEADRKQAGWGENRGTGKFPNRKLIGSKQDGEKVEEREKLPNRKLIGSKRVGEKIRETGKFPNWKTERRKLIGEKI